MKSDLVLGLVGKACDFGKEVVKNMGQEAHGQAMSELYIWENCDADFDARRDFILNSKEFTDEEKDKKLDELSMKRFKCYKETENINDKREINGERLNKIATGILTGGISYIPDFVGKRKINGNKKGEGVA